MRTNIVLEDDLVEEATRLAGIRTERELVQEALRVLIATRKRTSLLERGVPIKLVPGSRLSRG